MFSFHASASREKAVATEPPNKEICWAGAMRVLPSHTGSTAMMRERAKSALPFLSYSNRKREPIG